MTPRVIRLDLLSLITVVLGIWLLVTLWGLPSIWGKPLALAGAVYAMRRLVTVAKTVKFSS